MFKKQIKVNIENLDVMISELQEELKELKGEEYQDALQRVDALVETRCKLAESSDKGSIKTALVSGAFSIASILIVLKYEEKDIITSKAYQLVPKMFKR